MKLNENSWHARLYKVVRDPEPDIFTREVTLPKDLCNYFWLIVFYLITMPIYYPGMLLRISTKQRDFLRGIAVVCTGFLINVFIVCGSIVSYQLHVEGSLNVYLSLLLGFAFLPSIAALAFLLAYLAERVQSKTKSRDSFIGMTSEYFKAKKESYCPKIEWDENEDSKADSAYEPKQ